MLYPSFSNYLSIPPNTKLLNRISNTKRVWINPSIITRFVGVQFIKEPGRWESLEMVQRYTRSVSFHDSLV